jgi:hypothetical protein
LGQKRFLKSDLLKPKGSFVLSTSERTNEVQEFDLYNLKVQLQEVQRESQKLIDRNLKQTIDIWEKSLQLLLLVLELHFLDWA